MRNQMNRKKIAIGIFIVGGSFVNSLMAKEDLKPRTGQNIEVIDVPTAEVVDHYGYHVSFRFGSEGALQAKTTFGVFPHLNLGFGLDGERILGTQNGRLNKPSINVKYQLLETRSDLPGLALGFDGQGYVYNRTLGQYEQREKGFYGVATAHFLFPDLFLHL